MKFIVVSMTVASLIVGVSAIATEMPELAKKSNCTACHAIDRKIVGPSWNEVAERYRGDSSAEAYLINKVANGGSGVWGDLPEIQNSLHVSNEDIKTLVKFVLALNQPANISTNNLASNPSNNTPTRDPSIECSIQINSKKEWQILKGKIGLKGSIDQPLEILANTSFPNKKEQVAISLWMNEEKRCKQLGDEWRSNKYPPEIITIVDRNYVDKLFLVSDLYAKKISYGDFAKGQVKLRLEFRKNLAEAVLQIRQQLQQKQQTENKKRDDSAKQQQHIQQQQAENQRIAALERQQRYLQDLQIEQLEQQERRRNMPRCSSLPPGLRGYKAAAGECVGELYPRSAPMPRTYNSDCTTDYRGNVRCTTNESGLGPIQ